MVRQKYWWTVGKVATDAIPSSHTQTKNLGRWIRLVHWCERDNGFSFSRCAKKSDKINYGFQRGKKF